MVISMVFHDISMDIPWHSIYSDHTGNISPQIGLDPSTTVRVTNSIARLIDSFIDTQFTKVIRVAIHLENQEKSGSLTLVGKSQGKLWVACGVLPQLR